MTGAAGCIAQRQRRGVRVVVTVGTIIRAYTKLTEAVGWLVQ